jgi:hypothetical protein
MKITTVSLSRTIPTGPYMSDKVTMEASVHGGESHETVLDNLSHLINDWHRKANPHLHQEPEMTRFPPQLGVVAEAIPVISKDKEKIEIYIDNATSLEELQGMKDECWKHDLSANYITKFNELNNGRPSEFSEGLDKIE